MLATEPAPVYAFPDCARAPAGILLVNLGTPDAPTPRALRRYLREFLWDPRVVELSRPLWWLILNLLVVPLRAPRSAKLYRMIWTDAGSPLLSIAERQAAALQSLLREDAGAPVEVQIGMRYGRPSIAAGLRALREKECDRVLVLPLFPQYSAPTTASVFDAVGAEMKRWRVVPQLGFVTRYHDDPGYVRALVSSIRDVWEREGEPDRLLFSFHGMPVRYREAGDPYFWQCHRTARLVARELGLPTERWLVAFQSRFGREEWLQPHTDVTLREWAGEGVASVDVVCPGFAADCLETLEEIDIRMKALFLRSGGKRFRYIAALNDRSDHIRALSTIARRHIWPH